MSFDVLISSTKRESSGGLIGGRKKRKIPQSSNLSGGSTSSMSAMGSITHTIPSLASYHNTFHCGPSSSSANSGKLFEYNKTEEDKKYHYTLSFTVRFPYSFDTVFLSYFYPFSYSDLQGWLNILTISPVTSSPCNIFR